MSQSKYSSTYAPSQTNEHYEDFYIFQQRGVFRRYDPIMKIASAILLSGHNTGLTPKELCNMLRFNMEEQIITSTLEQMQRTGEVECVDAAQRETPTKVFIIKDKQIKASLDEVLKIIDIFNVPIDPPKTRSFKC